MTPTILTLTAPLTVTVEEYTTVELACAPPVGAMLELSIAGVMLEAFLRPGDALWRWRWTASGATGAFRVELHAIWPDGATQTQIHTLAVQPRKLDAERYQALLADLQALSRRLVLALGGGAEPAAVPTARAEAPPTPVEAIALLTGPELERFTAAVQRIARRPPERTLPRITPVAPGQARDLSRLGATRFELADDVPLTPDETPGAAHLRAIPEQQSAPTHDSYELRLLQRTLIALARRLDQLTATPDLPPQAAADLTAAQAHIHNLRALPILTGIPALDQYRGPTPRLQRDTDYRQVLRMWHHLRRSPELDWNDASLALPISDLPRLYERWCALAVAVALLDLPHRAVITQHMLAPPPAEPLLALPTDEPLLSLERIDGTGISLWYQPRYRPNPKGNHMGSLDRHIRIPDLALGIARPGSPPELIILDAKYRLDATGGVPESALADAYSYLGSIGRAGGERSVRSAAILYPGLGPAEIYPSGVAALPLLPGTTDALSEWIATHLQG